MRTVEASTFATVRERFDPLRSGGYALYLTWILCAFYNTFLLMGADDTKATLYLNMLPSMLSLSLTLLLVPRLVRNADKRVLSRAWTWGAGALMAASTVLLAFADSATVPGTVVTVVSAVSTGASSGILYLGWCRLYTDAGPRQAMAEMSLAFLAAALLDALLSHLPAPVSIPLVTLAALGSALALRRSSFKRPERPRPSRDHHLHARTRRMFARGLVAAASVGLVAGLLDVLAGFHYVSVPGNYEVLLAVGVAAMAAVMLAMALFARDLFVVAARRVVLAVLILGSLLTVFLERLPGLSEIVVFGAYQVGFSVTLCAICIDVSNYFDQPATRAFGLAFGTMYLGESLGNGLGHFLTLGLRPDQDTLAVITFLLCAVLMMVTLFLFAESDLVETSVGEMTDDDRDEEPAAVQSSVAGTGPGTLRQRGMPEPNEPAQRPDDHLSSEAPGQPSPIGRVPVAASVSETTAPASGGEPAQARDIDEIAEELSREFGLTPRESEVLPLILRGRTLARIQEELCISQGTAGTHTRHIYQKIGVHNRQALIDMLEDRLSHS